MRESVEREDRASKKNARLTAAAVEASEPRIQESANVDEKREEEKRRLAKRRLGRGGHVPAKLPPSIAVHASMTASTNFSRPFNPFQRPCECAFATLPFRQHRISFQVYVGLCWIKASAMPGRPTSPLLFAIVARART